MIYMILYDLDPISCQSNDDKREYVACLLCKYTFSRGLITMLGHQCDSSIERNKAKHSFVIGIEFLIRQNNTVRSKMPLPIKNHEIHSSI